MKNWIIPLEEFHQALKEDPKTPFAMLMRHGSMSVELYAPRGDDHQTPHKQDELYFVRRGSGVFVKDGERRPFGPGTVIFAEAGSVHRFEEFGDDFETWVVFWGPSGGEKDH